ncbi:hypothetical protein U8335_13595 [Roseiconus lacunae]|uniref:hypothetical protein n=1 Tax=Roseiconus lacunae TaxID=2605694 RepID=UPI0030866065|nr:hypothetical protein U8335_13595 [Stieleria sp. HD01]
MGPETLSATGYASVLCCDLVLAVSAARRCFKEDGVAVQLSTAILLFWCSTVTSSLVLGAVNLLNAIALHAAVLVQLAIIWAACSILPHATPERSWLGKISSTPVSTPVCTKAKRLRQAGSTAIPAWQIVFISFCAAHVITYGIIQLPSDWDSLSYHIPIIAHWIQSSSLWDQSCAFWYVPGNSELLGLFTAIAFDGDYWVQSHNLVPAALLFSTLNMFASTLRLPQIWVAAVATAVFATQPVIRQLVSAENDLAVTSLFTAGALFGWRWVRFNRPADLIFLAVSTGLLAGVKYYALAYSVLLVAVPLLWRLARKDHARVWQLVFSSAVAVLVLAGFWYYRNWLISGTPLYPKGFWWMPDLWSEIRPHFSSSRLIESNLRLVLPLLARAWLIQGGPVPATVMFLAWVPAALVVVAAAKAVVSNERVNGNSIAIWLSVLSFGAGVAYLVTPNVVETEYRTMNMLKLQYHPVRFGMSSFVVTLLAITALADKAFRLRPAFRDAALTVFVASTLVQFAWQCFAIFNFRTVPGFFGVDFWWAAGKSQLLVIWCVAFAASMLLVTAVAEVARKCSFAMAMVVVSLVLTVILSVSTPILARRWHNRFTGHFSRVLRSDCVRSWEGLKRPGDRLGVYSYRYYPYLGSRRENQVVRALWHRDSGELRDFVTRNKLTVVVFPTSEEVAHLRYRNSRAWFHDEFTGEMIFYSDRRQTLARLPSALPPYRPTEPSASAAKP